MSLHHVISVLVLLLRSSILPSSAVTAVVAGDDTGPAPPALRGRDAKTDAPGRVERKLNLENQGHGDWEPVFDLKLIPIHAMLLPPPGNKVLLYGTNTGGRRAKADGKPIYYEIWDLDRGVDDQDEAHSDLLEHDTTVDVFCSSMNVDPSSGNVIIIGGDDRTKEGIPNAMEYDTRTGQVHSHPGGGMHHGRWYPTTINLPNGDIFVIGGRDADAEGAAVPEVWSPDGGFRRLAGAEVPIIASKPGKNNWWYPHTYVNSGGEIVVIMPRSVEGSSKKAFVYRVGVDGGGSIEEVGTKPFHAHVRSPSIMFRTDRVLMLDDKGGLWVADISNASKPKWVTQDANLGTGRTNGAMAMLPDGRVAIVGGCDSQEDNGLILDKAVKSIHIWDPETDAVEEGPDQDRARLYHSTALVLPDGRVFSGGGGSPGPEKNQNGQLFSPGYLFDEEQRRRVNGDRITITDCPINIKSGDVFHITVDVGGDPSRVAKVTATKSGASSHTRNCDTRWLDLNIEHVVDDGRGATIIRVYAPHGNVMIGGLWMLNVLDENGVPSVASMVGVNMMAAPLAGTAATTTTASATDPPAPGEQNTTTTESAAVTTAAGATSTSAATVDPAVGATTTTDETASTEGATSASATVDPAAGATTTTDVTASTAGATSASATVDPAAGAATTDETASTDGATTSATAPVAPSTDRVTTLATAPAEGTTTIDETTSIA